MKKNNILFGLLALFSLGCGAITSCNKTPSEPEKPIVDPDEPQESEEEKAAKQQANAVITKINALTDSSSEKDVMAVLDEYSKLSDYAKTFVTTEAKNKLDAQVNRIREEKIRAKVQPVIDAIDKLNDKSTKEQIVKVKAEYDKLDEDLKSRVTNAGKIDELLKAIEEKEKQAKVDAVIAAIDKLNENSSKEEVLAVQDMYNKLDDELKPRVTNAGKIAELLAKIEEKEKQAKAQVVIDAIDALTDSSTREEVYAAKAKYDELDDDLKGRVTNLDKLNAQIVRVDKALADKFTAKVNALVKPETIIELSNEDVMRKHFESFSLAEEYLELPDESRPYLKDETITKLSNYVDELEKSVSLGIHGGDGESPVYYEGTDWNRLPYNETTSFESWDLDTSIEPQEDHKTMKDIYATKTFVAPGTKAIGFMVKSTKACTVDFFANVSEGQLVNKTPINANEWTLVVSNESITENFENPTNLSLFRFYSSDGEFADSDVISISSLFVVNDRSEELNQRLAAECENLINNLNESSSEEDVDNVAKKFYELPEGAKSLVSADNVAKIRSLAASKITNVKNVVDAIGSLPAIDSYTLPEHLYILNKINFVDSAYNQLFDHHKYFVEDIDVLDAHKEKCEGYNLFKEMVQGVANVIPSYVVSHTSTIGGTGTYGVDDTYGNYINVTPDNGGRCALDFQNFTGYQAYSTVYFYVNVSIDCYIYVSDGLGSEESGSAGWGDTWKNNYNDIAAGDQKYWCQANTWKLIAIDASSQIICNHWALGFWTDENDFTFKVSSFYGKAAQKIESDYYFGQRTATTETYSDFGTVYNLIQEQWFIDNPDPGTMASAGKGVLRSKLPTGFTKISFAIYNPNDTDSTYHISGGDPWGDGAPAVTLGAKTWTIVDIVEEDIALNDTGQIYYYISNSDTAGWKITALYAVK